MADDRLVKHLEERVSQLTVQVAEREALLDHLRTRLSGTQRLGHDAARAHRERDKARAAETASKQEATNAREQAREAEREAARLRTQLEDERAFVESVKDTLARLDSLEERVKKARSVGDLFTT